MLTLEIVVFLWAFWLGTRYGGERAKRDREAKGREFWRDEYWFQ